MKKNSSYNGLLMEKNFISTQMSEKDVLLFIYQEYTSFNFYALIKSRIKTTCIICTQKVLNIYKHIIISLQSSVKF